MALDSLMGEAHFKFEAAARLQEEFELKSAGHLQLMHTAVWKEPRMFSLKQLRDSFFALQHQSKQTSTLEAQVAKQKQLKSQCSALAQTDKQLQSAIKVQGAELVASMAALNEQVKASLSVVEKTVAGVFSKQQQMD